MKKVMKYILWTLAIMLVVIIIVYMSMENENKNVVIVNETNNLVEENNEQEQIFLYSQKYDDSTFELDESCKEYFEIEVQKNLSDKTSQVKVIPLKESEKLLLIIYETHKEDNVPKAVNVYKYNAINKLNSDNQLVTYFENDEKEILYGERVVDGQIVSGDSLAPIKE